MRPIGFHVIMKLVDGSVLAADEAARRALATVVLEQGVDARLVAFRAPDTHVHGEVWTDRQRAGQFARETEIALHRSLGLRVGFADVYIKPIEDQGHAYGTGRYILRQDRHHGVETDPYHEASNLPDLAGMRLNGRYTEANLRGMLPRIRREELLELIGAPGLATADRDFRYLGDAAAAAIAVPSVASKSPMAIEARRAAAHLARRELSTCEIAERLGVHPATVRRLLIAPPHEALAQAIDLQVRLRTVVRPRQLGLVTLGVSGEERNGAR